MKCQYQYWISSSVYKTDFMKMTYQFTYMNICIYIFVCQCASIKAINLYDQTLHS